MRFERAFVLSIYLVAGLGFAALILSEMVGPMGWAGIVLAMGASNSRFQRLHPSRFMWRIMTASFLVYLSLMTFVFGQGPLEAGQNLLIFLQVNRLFVRRQGRDYTYILLLALLQILLSSILSFSPLIGFLFVGFMLCVVWALMLLQVKLGIDAQIQLRGASGLEAAASSSRRCYREAEGLLRPSYVLTSSAVSIVMLFVTIGLFLLTPRLETSLFQHPGGPAIHVAGFSDEVRLGEVGQILGNRKRVMRVRLETRGIDLGVPYWRGIALDHFDGRTWKKSLSYQSIYRTQSPLETRMRSPSRANVTQRYILEPLDSEVLFVLPRVLAIESTLPRVVRSYTDSFRTTEHRGRSDYVVYSRVNPPALESLRVDTAELPQPLAEIYLQLPELGSEVYELARSVTAGAPTTYDRVVALRDFLRDRYTYTLSPSSSGDAPVEDFLFRTREGHCEYFASALVVLCRSIGIPTRLVNGFLGGEFNSVGKHWIVRQGDAHSWVEVRFTRNGWVRFDPTPVGEAAGIRQSGTGWGSVLAQYLDYAELQWYYYVLDYDLSAQIELFSEVFSGEGSGHGWARPRRLARRAMQKLPAVAALLVSLMAVAVAVVLTLRMRPRGPCSQQLTLPSGRRFMRKRRAIMKELSRRGFARGLGETPLERAGRAGRALELEGPLEQVEEIYYAARFGEVPIPLEAVTQAQDVLGRLRKRPTGRTDGE